MNIFVDQEIEITVKLYVCGSAAWTGNIYDKRPEVVDEKNLKTFTIVFRIPTYADEIDLSDTSVQVDSSGRMHILSDQIRFRRFAKLLKRWDLIGKNGEIMPTTIESIGTLNPKIGALIAEDLENQLLSE